MRQVSVAVCALLGAAVLATGCDMGKLTVGTTAKVLVRAQPSLKGESDYDLAARAIPGALKTIEGFWVVDPDNDALRGILMEGYCQYGTGFVEDEWERAKIAENYDEADYQAARATKMYLRCMNYALRGLGSRWQTDLFSDVDTVKKLVASAPRGRRNSLMWAAVGLGSAVNMNKDRVEMISHFDTVQLMLEKVIEFDSKSLPADRSLAALPHIAMGLIYSSRGEQLGGDPEKAKAEFEQAIQLTDGKYLLANVYFARKYAVMKQDRKLFHETLVKVLTTPASIWPEQRLANEIAHRRARRYLKLEKELFP